MKKNNFSIFEIKKFLYKKGFIVKKIDEKKKDKTGSIYRTLLASLLIISFFFTTPMIINFTESGDILDIPPSQPL